MWFIYFWISQTIVSTIVGNPKVEMCKVIVYITNEMMLSIISIMVDKCVLGSYTTKKTQKANKGRRNVNGKGFFYG